MPATSAKIYNFKTAGFSVMTDTRLIMRGLFLRDIDERRERIDNLRNHIRADDYFGSLATIIDLVRQKMKNSDPPLRETLDNLKNDLIYLQEEYRIVKKTKKY